LKSLVWALVLLLMITYVFAIIFCQAQSEWTISQGAEAKPEDAIEDLHYWKRLIGSMVALFMTISGGVDWEAVANPLAEIHWIWMGVFIAYVAFTVFAVLNVVTGVFCQSAVESAAQDHEMAVAAATSRKIKDKERFTALFAHMDSDGSGEITLNELEEQMEREDLQIMLNSLELDAHDAIGLFKLLNEDQDETVEVDEFINGCLRLKGTAKSLDIAKMNFAMASLVKHFSCFADEIESSFSKMSAKLEGSIKQQNARLEAKIGAQIDARPQTFTLPVHIPMPTPAPSSAAQDTAKPKPSLFESPPPRSEVASSASKWQRGCEASSSQPTSPAARNLSAQTPSPNRRAGPTSPLAEAVSAAVNVSKQQQPIHTLSSASSFAPNVAAAAAAPSNHRILPETTLVPGAIFTPSGEIDAPFLA